MDPLYSSAKYGIGARQFVPVEESLQLSETFQIPSDFCALNRSCRKRNVAFPTIVFSGYICICGRKFELNPGRYIS